MNVEQTQSTLKVRFLAEPKRLQDIRSKIQMFTDSLGCGHEISSELVLAINEACMNIIQHAYHGDCNGEIELKIEQQGDELVCLLCDFAEPCDVSTIKPRDLDEIRPGGLGTHFINTIMDDCHYGRLKGRRGNYVRMTRKIG